MERDRIFHHFLQQNRKVLISDRGFPRQQFKNIQAYPFRLRQMPEGMDIFWQNGSQDPIPYPRLGEVPEIRETGLEFLHPDITEACVCLGSRVDGVLYTQWWGRNALRNVQFWSATKIIPLLQVIAAASPHLPNGGLEQCIVRRPGRRAGIGFQNLAVDVISYQGDRLFGRSSNNYSAILKRFTPYAEQEFWVQQLTGNSKLEFQGNYGSRPSIQFPELFHVPTQTVLLTAAPLLPTGQNLVSAYDLTRLISMLGWHPHLPPTAQIPDAHWHNLQSAVLALGQDCARFVEAAIALLNPPCPLPVVLSKVGYGASDQRHTDEMSYTVLIQFTNAVSLACTLRAVRPNHQKPNSQSQVVDAQMATAIAQILSRILSNSLS